MPWKLSEHLFFGTQFGLATGYGSAVMPVVIPELRYEITKKLDFNLGFIPPVGTPGLVGAYFTIGF